MIISSWLDPSCTIPTSPNNHISFPAEGLSASVSTELHHDKEKSSYKEIYLILKNNIDRHKLPAGFSDTQNYLDNLKQLCLVHPEKEYLRPYIRLQWPPIPHILSDWRKNNEQEPVFMIFPNAFQLQMDNEHETMTLTLKFTLLG